MASLILNQQNLNALLHLSPERASKIDDIDKQSVININEIEVSPQDVNALLEMSPEKAIRSDNYATAVKDAATFSQESFQKRFFDGINHLEAKSISESYNPTNINQSLPSDSYQFQSDNDFTDEIRYNETGKIPEMPNKVIYESPAMGLLDEELSQRAAEVDMERVERLSKEVANEYISRLLIGQDSNERQQDLGSKSYSEIPEGIDGTDDISPYSQQDREGLDLEYDSDSNTIECLLENKGFYG